MFKYTIYSSRRLPMNSKGHQVVVNFGCDGKNHATCIIKEHEYVNGILQFAEHLGDNYTGPCTGRCKGRLTKGGFIFD